MKLRPDDGKPTIPYPFVQSICEALDVVVAFGDHTRLPDAVTTCADVPMLAASDGYAESPDRVVLTE